jgi:hypothetical protein
MHSGTLAGRSGACQIRAISAVLAGKSGLMNRLEALEVRVDQQVTRKTDTVNPLPESP